MEHTEGAYVQLPPTPLRQLHQREGHRQARRSAPGSRLPALGSRLPASLVGMPPGGH